MVGIAFAVVVFGKALGRCIAHIAAGPLAGGLLLEKDQTLLKDDLALGKSVRECEKYLLESRRRWLTRNLVYEAIFRRRVNGL